MWGAQKRSKTRLKNTPCKNAFKKHPLQNRTNVQIKGGGVKGLLNNVQKNFTFLARWLPLSKKYENGFPDSHFGPFSLNSGHCQDVSKLPTTIDKSMITINNICHQKWADAAHLLPGPCLRVGVLGSGRPWLWVRSGHGGRGCGQAGGAGGQGS